MRRLGSFIIAGTLALLGGGASAQDFEVEFPADAGPALELQLGASPTRSGFKLVFRGGAPRSWAQLCVKPVGRPVVRQLLRLDEQGAAELTVLDARFDRDLDAWVAAWEGPEASNNGGWSALTTPVRVPSHLPAAPQQLQRGDVIVTEFMKDPSFVSDAAGEWFELYNRTAHAIDLEGWRIADLGTNQHVINRQGQGLWIAPGGFLVLGINANTSQNGGIAVAYKYSNFTLTNGADAIVLIDTGGLTVDEVQYDDGIFWPDTPGRSASLDPASFDALANDQGANWCDASTPVGGGNTDWATPGQANSNCP